MARYDYDLIVLGAGSAGLSLSSVAARLGVKVALIDAGSSIGGDCLHYGCVPSKTLIRSAKVAHLARTGKEYGIETGNVSTDFAAVMNRIRRVISTIQDHVDNADRFRSMGCDVWENTKAVFIDPHTVHIGEKSITGKKIAICVGSRPRELQLDGLQEAGFITNESVFSLKEQPKRLIIIGSGPVGCELAQAFQRLGTEVTLVNRSDSLLGKEDSDVQQHIKEVFVHEGIKLRLGVEMQSVHTVGNEKVVQILHNGQTESLHADEILVAVGRVSNADSLQVEKAGVRLTDKGYIHTNAKLQTSKKHIYAAGDVTGHLQFTHSAGYEAGILVSNAILHFPKKVQLKHIPRATFTDPEVASTGINEMTAKEKKIEHSIHTFSFSNQDRALAENENGGFIKLILGKKEKILGCQIVGPHAGELIHEWIIAQRIGLNPKHVAQITHVYPTLSGANQQISGEIVGKKFFTPLVRGILRGLFGYRNKHKFV